MARFEDAIETVIRHEGGYTVDHAGATNYGVTVRALRAARMDIDGDGDVDANDVAVMTLSDAINFYRGHYWQTRYDDIDNQQVATKVFDMAVNMGHHRAHSILQRELNQAGEQLAVDGILGPITLAAINRAESKRLLALLRVGAANFYAGLVAANPGRYSRYINGWMRRAYS